MDTIAILFFSLLILVCGAGLGFFVATARSKRHVQDSVKQSEKIIQEGENDARRIRKEAHDLKEKAHLILEEAHQEAEQVHKKTEKVFERVQTDQQKILAEAKTELAAARKKSEDSEKIMLEREKLLNNKNNQLDQKKGEIEKKIAEVEKYKNSIQQTYVKQQEKLAEIAKLSPEEAKQKLLAQVERNSAKEILKKIQGAEEKAKAEAEQKANKIIALAIQRLAQDVTSESTVTLVSLPSDDLKGRIIGREGRNITAFEMATGVDVIVDDTPGAVLISGFDPVRRNNAKIALEKLIVDGRIHPARIEDAVKKAQAETEKFMQELGEKAVLETGLVGLPLNLIKLIGRLRFRTSYGQNILKHSIETAFLGAILASELKIDVKTAKAACLFHDIGKAVDHEIEGPHAVIGANILRKFKVRENIIHAVEAHHEDIPIESTLDIIVQVADAITASRPGARRENLESYIKRLEELENIAKSFNGVTNSYAIQAGREVRVIVEPGEVDDLGVVKLAKEIAGKIENEITYPGQIRVNVIREKRAEDFAR